MITQEHESKPARPTEKPIGCLVTVGFYIWLLTLVVIEGQRQRFQHHRRSKSLPSK